MSTAHPQRSSWARATVVALLALLPLSAAAPAAASTAVATPDAGQARISAFEETRPGVQLLYTGTELPGGSGLDPDSVDVTFSPVMGPTTGLTASARTAGTVERHVVLALDTSGSLGEDGIQAVREAARSFVEQVPPSTEVGLVTFGRPAVPVLEPTADRAPVLAAIDGLTRAGDTALYDAVLLATDMLEGQGSERIVLMTDGQDQAQTDGSVGSVTTLDEAAAAVGNSGAGLTAVAFGDAALGPLQQLADAGGGQSVVPADDSAALTAAFDAVVEEIATELLVEVEVPDDLRGQTGTLTVAVDTAAGTTSASRTGALGTAVAPPPPAEPSVEPSVEPSEDAVVVAPPVASELGLVLPPAFVVLAVVAVFLALLVVAVVFVGGHARRNSPAAARQRNLAVYNIGGRGAQVADREAAATKLGDNAVARSAVELAGRVVERRGTGEQLARKLEAAGVPLRAAEWLVLCTAAVVGAGALLLLLSGGNAFAMFLGLVIGAVVPQVVLSFRRSKREKAFLAVLPDTLSLMASGLRAGYSMPQSMDSVSREGQEPVKSEFARALVEARLGVPPEDALEGIADRMGSRDFRWVIMALRIQREVGGNLAELLDTVAATIRERARLRRQVDTLSAEGRLSAWIIGGLPVAFALYTSVAQPEYLRVLYTDPLGIALSVVAVVVFVVGVLLLRWAIKVEV